MDRALRDEWIKALRSGQYKQTQNRLRGKHFVGDRSDNDTYMGHCCLGVLACILAPKYPEKILVMDEQIQIETRDTEGNRAGFTATAIPAWLEDEVSMISLQVIQLITLNDFGYYTIEANREYVNDMEPATFEQIADYIEKNF